MALYLSLVSRIKKRSEFKTDFKEMEDICSLCSSGFLKCGYFKRYENSLEKNYSCMQNLWRQNSLRRKTWHLWNVWPFFSDWSTLHNWMQFHVNQTHCFSVMYTLERIYIVVKHLYLNFRAFKFYKQRKNTWKTKIWKYEFLVNYCLN